MAADIVITPAARLLEGRHIQNFTEASSLEAHWGYASRAMPCTNDAGSCAYLDVVYHSHDLGMMYTGIFWATVAGILFSWAIGRRLFGSARADEVATASGEDVSPAPRGFVERAKGAVSATCRRRLLPDALRPIFGRISRLQVLILSILVGYLTIWSFVGIVYKKWVTPVNNMDGVYNTRTSLGPWSDRVGVLAYALTPLSVLLGSRESVLSLLTGISYQHFNFLHRWLGYLIFVQSAMHTIGWCIIEAKLYQPQPSVGSAWIKQLYMVWGVVAMILLTLLFVLCHPVVIKMTGYEFFRKSHYVLAMIYIGAAIGHWENLQCFLIPGIGLWVIDRFARLARSAMIHRQVLPAGGSGFRAANGEMAVFPDADDGDVVRMEFNHPHDPWLIGQHFYLTFPESSIWQAHPFTPLNLPTTTSGTVKHSYIFRARSGETKKVAALAVSKNEAVKGEKSETRPTTSVILTGPYGTDITRTLLPNVNALAIAGGTGIAFVLPVLLHLVRCPVSQGRKVKLVWVVRRDTDIEWVRPELDALLAAAQHEVEIVVFATRASGESNLPAAVREDKSGPSTVDSASATSSSTPRASGLSVVRLGSEEHRHPDLKAIIDGFVESSIRGSTNVYMSGPGGMLSDVRKIVAERNDGVKVWKGDWKGDVRLVTDDRLEW